MELLQISGFGASPAPAPAVAHAAIAPTNARRWFHGDTKSCPCALQVAGRKPRAVRTLSNVATATDSARARPSLSTWSMPLGSCSSSR